jgi:hypothetical protein
MRYYISGQRIKKLAVKESSLIARGGEGGKEGGGGRERGEDSPCLASSGL